MSTAEIYTQFAAYEARGVSPTYERLALAVAGDDRVLALLDRLPAARRQPNLLFGVVRLLGGPVHDPTRFHQFTVENWPAVEADLRTRVTQTNEAGRCAVLLPVAGLYPSLHLNLADCYRKLGDLPRARDHLHRARAGIGALGEDAYGQLIRSGLDRLTEQLSSR